MGQLKIYLIAMWILAAPSLAHGEPESAPNTKPAESENSIRPQGDYKLEELKPGQLNEPPTAPGEAFDKKKLEMPPCPWPPCADDKT